jgi:L-2,4-diaminobutyrate decarboxylase
VTVPSLLAARPAFDGPRHALALEAAADLLAAAPPSRPIGAAGPSELRALTARLQVVPDRGRDLQEVLADLGGLLLAYGTDSSHPWCVAHLNTPPLPAAVAADALVAATNGSLDTWDGSPIATHLERCMIAALAAEVGFDPATADGVFTSGGTQSNLMGVLLARDTTARRAGGDATIAGLAGTDAGRYRILCSQVAHHSLHRAAWILGLGGQAVVPVPVDRAMRVDVAALDRTLEELAADGLLPMLIAATAGDTDYCAVDPLPELAVRARQHGMWLHVDAAVGGGLLFSDRHRHLLDGLAAADSIAIDGHKLLWQPAACGVFLVADGASLAGIDHRVAYLNEA